MRRNYFILLFILFTGFISAFSRQIIPPDISGDSYFIIVIDEQSFQFTQNAVFAYKQSIEKQGLPTYILIDRWKNPDEIKLQILQLYTTQKGLEGVVFVGDIPIAMIRDAQHLTSAFKIDQNSKRFPWQKTSVPSDRFYDDFDLKFTYLKQDTANPLLHYYSLNADSPQRIECDIYSGRIKPSLDGTQNYELLKKYLFRIAEQKNRSYDLKRALVYTGHGYHSESLNAWAGSVLRYREQFPLLFSAKGRMLTLNHAMRTDIKAVILRELQNAALDMAVFHAHGAYDTQYLIGLEPAQSISQNVEAIKLFLRSKLRQAKRRKKSVEAVQLDYMTRYNIPKEWFEDIWNDSLQTADSLLYANQDIYIEDIGQIKPQAKFIYFDECFNGAFIHSSYIAGSYLFNDGQVIATAANSVNVRQDVWASEYLGLLNYGLRVGNWVKLHNSLELHLLGDPTFNFATGSQENIAEIINQRTIEEKTVETWLDGKDIPLQTLAVSLLFKKYRQDFEDELFRLYQNQSGLNVRLEALKYLAQLRSKKFEKLLFKSIHDPSEFIRRISAFWMGDVGRKDYLPVLMDAYLWDSSSRVRFNAKGSIEKIDAKAAIPLAKKQIAAIPKNFLNDKNIHIIASLQRTDKWLNEELLKQLENPEELMKKRLSAVRTFRNYRFQTALPNLIRTAFNPDEDSNLRQLIFEALGWFSLSYQREKIISACDKALKQDNLPIMLKNEIIRTKSRILAGPNNPILP